MGVNLPARRPKRDFREIVYRLGDGDGVLFYTDGAVRAKNGSGEDYGKDRLREAVEKYISLGVSQMSDKIYKEIVDFTKRDSQDDDIAMIIVKTL